MNERRTLSCHHFDAGRCRSCTWLPTPYADQLATKASAVAALIDCETWLPPVPSALSGFRNKAKMVVTGASAEPTLGIVGPDGVGIDLRDCALHSPGLVAAMPVLAEFIAVAGLSPYDIAGRRGELKHLIVTESPDAELMVRLVLRSREAETRIRKHLPWLTDRLPARVVSLNLQPEHKAVLEGERELLMTAETALPMRLNELTLYLRPQSFFQTNTAVAAELYRLAQAWTADLHVRRIWDLYCGVGGFALHLAGNERRVWGVEISPEAVASAERSAAELRPHAAKTLTFEAGEAMQAVAAAEVSPDLVIVNPPRRGLGPELAGWIEGSGVSRVLYSSCNPESLSRDLRVMDSLRARQGVVLDMFPHTTHAETLVLLSRL